MIRVFDLLDAAPASVWLAIFAGLAVLAGWLWFGWRVTLLSAALIAAGLIVGLLVAVLTDAAFALALRHPSLVIGFVLGFVLGGSAVLVAWILWGACVVGSDSDQRN